MVELTEGMRLEKRKNHTIEAIVDRIILKLTTPATPSQTASPSEVESSPSVPPNSQLTPQSSKLTYDTRRLETSVLKALQMANGLVLIGIQDPVTRKQEETLYSSSMACPDCGINVPRLEPRSFSFNSNYGACPGSATASAASLTRPRQDPSSTGQNPSLDGAMGPGSASAYLLITSSSSPPKNTRSTSSSPSNPSPPTSKNFFLCGPHAARPAIGFSIFNYLRSNLEDTKSGGYRDYMMRYMTTTTCPVCKGRRLRPESLAVTIPIP